MDYVIPIFPKIDLKGYVAIPHPQLGNLVFSGRDFELRNGYDIDKENRTYTPALMVCESEDKIYKIIVLVSKPNDIKIIEFFDVNTVKEIDYSNAINELSTDDDAFILDDYY